MCRCTCRFDCTGSVQLQRDYVQVYVSVRLYGQCSVAEGLCAGVSVGLTVRAVVS